METDAQLLGQFVASRSEDAFRSLVERHLPMVCSAAARQLPGCEHMAADVSQAVFVLLASKADKLRGVNSLAGWLYAATRNQARAAWRGEMRRRKREKLALMPDDSSSSPEPTWEAIRPVLDESMHRLSAKDREALLLRYFQGQDYRAVGQALSLSENAARMRVQRAVEKLRRLLAKRGVTSTAWALSPVLANHAQAAPMPELAIALSRRVISLSHSPTLLGPALLMTTKTKLAWTGLGILLAISASAPAILRQESELRARLHALEQAARPILRPLLSASRQAPIDSAKIDPDNMTVAEIVEELAATLTDNPDPYDDSARRVNALLARLKPAEFPEALRLAQQVTFRQRYELCLRLILRWAEVDGLSALQYAERLPSFRHYLRQIIGDWARHDTAGVISWLHDNWDRGSLGMIESPNDFALAAIAQVDFDKAFEFAQSVSSRKQHALMGVFRGEQITPSRADQLLQACKDLSPRQGKRVLHHVLGNWANHDLFGIKAWVDNLPEGDMGRDAKRSFAASWAGQDPEKGLAYGLSVGATLLDLRYGLAEWTQSDPDKASAWFLSQPPSADKDQVAKKWLQALSQHGSAKKAEWEAKYQASKETAP